jgi:DNA-binding response OmpR family regulator
MKKILVIEDDAALQTAYQDALTKAGYTPIIAGNGDQGLELVKSQTPDCIILDIFLPGGSDGIAVLTKLKHDDATKLIPVIMMTNAEDLLNPTLDLGAMWYFVKAETTLDVIVGKLKEILHE